MFETDIQKSDGFLKMPKYSTIQSKGVYFVLSQVYHQSFMMHNVEKGLSFGTNLKNTKNTKQCIGFNLKIIYFGLIFLANKKLRWKRTFELNQTIYVKFEC